MEVAHHFYTRLTGQCNFLLSRSWIRGCGTTPAFSSTRIVKTRFITMARLQNGRLIDVPDSGISGQELISTLNPGQGRRVVTQSGITVESIKPGKLYSKSELTGRDGKPVRVKTMPDRTKGALAGKSQFNPAPFDDEQPHSLAKRIDDMPPRLKRSDTPSFGGNRSQLSKQIIFEQVQDISEKFYKDRSIDIDEDDANWVVFVEYLLPPRWKGIARQSPLLITFPMEYPKLPPVGFYLSASLPKSANGHLYQAAYHSADKQPLSKHWFWYCVYIASENWRPSPYQRPGDWRRGDNLWDYITMIGESLQSDD